MADLRTLRVLVVDDDPAYQYLVKWVLKREQMQWDVTIANDGAEALDVLFVEENTLLPDVILLDWNLPKVSGSEVLRRVKENRKLRKIPILVLSSSDADCDILAAYDEHANGYITKPPGIQGWMSIVETIERFFRVVQLPKVAR